MRTVNCGIFNSYFSSGAYDNHVFLNNFRSQIEIPNSEIPACGRQAQSEIIKLE